MVSYQMFMNGGKVVEREANTSANGREIYPGIQLLECKRIPQKYIKMSHMSVKF